MGIERNSFKRAQLIVKTATAHTTRNSIGYPLPLGVWCVSLGRAQGPVYEITPVESTVKFDVEASVAIKGVFDKWEATQTFTSTALK
jgi:hypothetical protein